MKYRKRQNFRVAYGFAGQLQEAMELYQGFLEPASGSGWQVIPLQEQFEIQLRRLIDLRAVDAVVGDFISRIWMKTLPADLPLVQLGGQSLAENIPSVCVNEADIGQRVTAHFKEMGYGTMLYFSPRMSKEICEEAGLEWVRSAESLRDRLRAHSSVGVLCASDFLARRGMQVTRSLELGVPEDVGFVGIGNRALDGILADRGISSFPIPYSDMGRVAAGLLAERMDGEAASSGT
jgi:DNA-binding LacI/PurR family transcriptional regulator